ncbi:hypothetical protein LINPERHAP2_LOCUS41935 [Linum perenne]
MVGDHYVVIQNWRPYFQPEDSPISTLRVWVRLPGVPLEYFDAAILTIIGNRIGKTVRLDLTTMGGSRGNFARICVEVDLSKPLLSKYRLRRRVRRIEYEGLHTICYSCGCFGHVQDQCHNKEEETKVEAPGDMVFNPVFQNKGVEDPRPEVEEDFGPWMKVSRAGRRGKKTAPVSSAPPPAADPSFGNQFNALADFDPPSADGDKIPHNEEGNSESYQDEPILGEENKENLESNVQVVGGVTIPLGCEASSAPMEIESEPNIQLQVKVSKVVGRGESASDSKNGPIPTLGPEKAAVRKMAKAPGKASSAAPPAGHGPGRPTKGPGFQTPLQQPKLGSPSLPPGVSFKGQVSTAPSAGGV